MPAPALSNVSCLRSRIRDAFILDNRQRFASPVNPRLVKITTSRPFGQNSSFYLSGPGRIHVAEEQAAEEGGGIEIHVLEDAGTGYMLTIQTGFLEFFHSRSKDFRN